MSNLPKPLTRALHAVMLLGTAILLGLHAVHLTADFPNHSRWMDWSKYTDEGWYGDAAIRHFQLGHWYVHGDFNPAAALPVWPFLEALVFHFTGVSVVAARALTVAVFACILAASWLLIARGIGNRTQVPLAASSAVLLLAASPFCFVFTRLAILEPLLILLTLLSLLTAQSFRPVSGPPRQSWPAATFTAIHRNLLPILALGLLLPLTVLTKTTALFLVPAVAWLLFASVGYRFWIFLRVGLPAATLGVGLWLLYFLVLIRPHFLLDYRYLFSANAYTGITRENFADVLLGTVKDGMWMGSILYPLALVALFFACSRFRRLRDYPLIPTFILWATGYTAFLAYHNNLQPRYYLVVAVPLTLLVPVVLESLFVWQTPRVSSQSFAVLACGIVILAIAIPDAHETLHFVRHPEYTLVEAAKQVHDYIADDLKQDPNHNPLVLSISGSDLSLMTGIHSICDDFGTLELPDRVNQYRPGWYVAWNEIDDDKMDALTPLFHIERVAAFPAMDDPDRNLMILYRLDPTVQTPLRLRKQKLTPKRLRARFGQQPSVNQLEH
jgi:hypothetical protein